MSIVRTLGFVTIIILSGGCATTSPPYYPVTTTIKTPQEGVVTRSELGDTLMIHTIKEEYDAIAIEGSREYNVCLYKLRINSQTAFAGARSETGEPVFYADAGRKGLGAGDFYEGGPKVRIEPSTKNRNELMLNDAQCGGPQPLLNTYRRIKTSKLDSPGFSQELIYNGRVDNYVKFIYREFRNQMARSAFTQEVQYDLGLSSEIGFKGVRIEIIDATNSEITYRVENHFEGL